jgi:hypothetical protein
LRWPPRWPLRCWSCEQLQPPRSSGISALMGRVEHLQASLSRRAFASFRSGVSRPSMNLS